MNSEICEILDELETAIDNLRHSRADARRYREALIGLFSLVRSLSCQGGLSNEDMRKYLRTHPAAIEAADALRADRL